MFKCKHCRFETDKRALIVLHEAEAHMLHAIHSFGSTAVDYSGYQRIPAELPLFPHGEVARHVLPLFAKIDLASWKYTATTGREYLLEEMSTDHLITAMCMIWNNYFCKKCRGCVPVELGRDYGGDFLGRSIQSQVITLNTLAWELIENRGEKAVPNHLRELSHSVLYRMHEVGMLHKSLYMRGLIARICRKYEDAGKASAKQDRTLNAAFDRLGKSYWGKNMSLPAGHDFSSIWMDEVDVWPGDKTSFSEIRAKITDVYGLPRELTWGAVVDESSVMTEQEILKEFFMSKKIRIVQVSVLVDTNRSISLTYMTNDPTVKADDFVVVEIRNFYAVGTVTEADITTNRKDLKWIVQKVDLTALNKTKADLAEAAKLQRQLEEKLATQNNLARYEVLASSDPEAAAALKRLKELQG